MSGCDPGTYSLVGLDNDGGCISCSGGTYAPLPRSTACLNCLAGSFAVSGASVCTQCAPGKYNEEGSTTCLECDYGWYAMGVGSTSCSACSVTASTSTTGSNSSQNCAVATYRGFSFGNNIWGQLGVEADGRENEAQARLFAKDLGNPMARFDNEYVLRVVPGYSHTLVMTQPRTGNGLGAKSVWAVGSNSHGELGPSGGQPPVCLHPDSADDVCTETPTL